MRALKYFVALIGCTILAVLFAVHQGSAAQTHQDKYTLKVPGGLSFSEFKGYESWQLISISHGGPVMAATLGNPVMIKAYLDGIPGNGKAVPDGAKMAKIHWTTKDLETLPGSTVPAIQHDVDFMVKDSKRFADSGGWGWAAFEYDAASDTFAPATMAAKPPQGNDAKCGFACYTTVKNRDHVFELRPQMNVSNERAVNIGSGETIPYHSRTGMNEEER